HRALSRERRARAGPRRRGDAGSAARAAGRPLRPLRRRTRRAHRAQAHRLDGARPARRRGVPPAREPHRRRRCPAARRGGVFSEARGKRRRDTLLSFRARCMSRTNELADCVKRSLERYFKDMDGEKPTSIHDMVLRNVEKPMIELVLTQAQGNQTLAAEMLGINRNTLRKKMKQLRIKG